MSDEKRPLAEAYYLVAEDMTSRADRLQWIAAAIAEYADHLSDRLAAEKTAETSADGNK